MNTPLPVVSVIVPVYNTAPYLHKCLDSVLGQTMPELEVICVNDGSTDDGPAILAEYAASDGRIRLISQENRGLSAARNRGMEIARGKFVYFLDSDDFIEPTTLEKAVKIAEDLQLEIVRFGYERYYDSESMYELHYKEHIQLDNTIGVCTGVEYLRMMKDAKRYSCEVWDILWLRSFLEKNHLLFKEGIIFEDHLFSFQAFFCAKKVMHVPEVLYHYRVRPNSLVTMPDRPRKTVGFFSSAEDVLASALHGEFDPAEERELSRAFSGMIRASAMNYSCLPTEDRKKIAFPRAIENELFKQTVAARTRVQRLKKKLERVTEASETLRLEVERLQRENEILRNELGQVRKTVAPTCGETAPRPEDEAIRLTAADSQGEHGD